MFGFTEVAISGYHPVDHKWCVWLQADKITLIN